MAAITSANFAETLQDASPAATLVGRSAATMPFVFFDLETTGLNGGAGTHAFLVGCGWFDEEGGFITEQHLMTDLPESVRCWASSPMISAGRGR